MVDPIKHLPAEALTQIFSHLSTPSLTRCESTSQAWRREILVDSVLQSKLDLTNLKRPFTSLELMQVIHDLSSRSNHYKEVHLDLTPFWQELVNALTLERLTVPFTFDQAMAATSFSYSSFITTMLLSFKGLERLHVYISQDDVNSTSDPIPLSQVIIQGAFQLSKKISTLRELHFKLPFPFSMSSGSSQDPNSRRFSIIQDNLWLDVEADALRCIEFLRKAEEFTGEGLNLFGVDSEVLVGWHWDVDRAKAAFDLFLRMVRRSTSTIKTMDLSFNEDRVPGEALQLVVSCPNLSSLSLNLYSPVGEGIRRIEFPIGASTSSIKSLKLILRNVELEWESDSLISWIGSKMERLHISTGNGNSCRTEVPMKSLVSVLNNNKLLEEVVLDSVLVIKDPNPSFDPQVSLPNLQSLSLDSVYAMASGLFDNLSASQIKRLEIIFRVLGPFDEKKGEEAENKKEVRDAFEHFALLLKSCCSSLKSLSVMETSSPPDQQVSQIESSIPSLSLTELRTLNLSSSSARLDNLLNYFSFPRIEVIASQATYLDPSSTRLIHQILADSSSSLERVTLGSFGLKLFGGPDTPIVIKSKNSNPQQSIIPSFSRLKTLELGTGASSSMKFFSKASFGGLEKIEFILSYEDEKSKRIQMQSLLSLLRSNASSLKLLKINRSVSTFDDEDSSSRFAKSRYDLEMLGEVKKNPINLSNLKSTLITSCHPLLDLLRLCKLPILSEFAFDDFGLRAPPKTMTREEFMAYDAEQEFEKMQQRRKDVERERAKAVERMMAPQQDYDSDDTEDMVERDMRERAESRANDWI